MRSMRALSVGFGLVVVASVVGCGVPWTVVRQSGPPSALHGVTSVSVSFDYSTMMVGGMGGDKTAEQWVADSNIDDPEYRATWAQLISAWEENFMTGIANASDIPVVLSTGGEVGPDVAAVTVTLNRLQIGKYMVVAAVDSQVNVSHTWSRGGTIVDQIETRDAVTPSMFQPSVFQHVTNMAQRMGKLSGRFINRAREN